jgi:hypothetical protein
MVDISDLRAVLGGNQPFNRFPLKNLILTAVLILRKKGAAPGARRQSPRTLMEAQAERLIFVSPLWDPISPLGPDLPPNLIGTQNFLISGPEIKPPT